MLTWEWLPSAHEASGSVRHAARAQQCSSSTGIAGPPSGTGPYLTQLHDEHGALRVPQARAVELQARHRACQACRLDYSALRILHAPASRKRSGCCSRCRWRQMMCRRQQWCTSTYLHHVAVEGHALQDADLLADGVQQQRVRDRREPLHRHLLHPPPHPLVHLRRHAFGRPGRAVSGCTAGETDVWPWRAAARPHL
jgi:hypothetical protein